MMEMWVYGYLGGLVAVYGLSLGHTPHVHSALASYSRLVCTSCVMIIVVISIFCLHCIPEHYIPTLVEVLMGIRHSY